MARVSQQHSEGHGKKQGQVQVQSLGGGGRGPVQVAEWLGSERGLRVLVGCADPCKMDAVLI